MNDRLKRFHTVWNYSSVDKIKDIAREIGWNGGKTERDRRFLSDLKILASEYCDMPFKSMEDKVHEFVFDDNSVFLFLHIREPDEIKRAVYEFGAKSILVIRDSVARIDSNPADRNVRNYDYDTMVINNGSLDDLREYVKTFVEYETEGVMR